MKKILLAFLVIGSLNTFAQCTELFFSEYVEGNQTNKSLEIYNPTSSPINLSNYQIHRWNNGTDIRYTSYTQKLSGTIPAKGTWVLVKDTNATEIVYYSLRNKANAFITTSCGTGSTNRTLCHNGNDAYTLERVAGNTVVDIFGQIGINPGEPTIGGGWNSNPATDYTAVDSSQNAWTTDHTLIRKHSVMTGVTTNPSGGSVNTFNVSIQWDSLSINKFDSLGSHTCDCKDYNGIINPNNSLLLEIYPNPSSNTIQIESAEAIASISINGFNGNLVLIKDFLNQDVRQTSIDIKNNHIASGEYLLTVVAKNGAMTTKRISIY